MAKRGKPAPVWRQAFNAAVEGLKATVKTIKVKVPGAKDKAETNYTHLSADNLQTAVAAFGGNVQHLIDAAFNSINAAAVANARAALVSGVELPYEVRLDRVFKANIEKWRKAKPGRENATPSEKTLGILRRMAEDSLSMQED